jgi:hypothetical protein
MRIILTIKLRDLGLDIKDRQALLAHVSSNTTKICSVAPTLYRKWKDVKWQFGFAKKVHAVTS